MSNDALKRFFVYLGRAALFMFAFAVMLLFSAILGLAPWLVFAIFGYVLFRFARMLIRLFASAFLSGAPLADSAFKSQSDFEPGDVGRPRDAFFRTPAKQFDISPANSTFLE